MAHTVLTDARIYVDAYDLSGDMNALSCEYVAEAVDDTNFGDAAEVNLGGVRSIAFEASGRVEESDSGSGGVLFAKLGLTDIPISFALAGADEGEVAYSFKALEASYSPGGTQGEAFAFEMSARGTSELVRGTILVDASAARTVSGSGTARQLGAVSAAQNVYAALHVLDATGTLDVVVQSDDNAGMTSALTQVTFAQATTIGSQFLSAAGPIADDWWQVAYTIGGGSPSFTFLVVVGIR